MTAVLAGVVAVLAGIAAAQLGLLIWLTRRALSATDRIESATEQRLLAQSETRDLAADLNRIEQALEESQAEQARLAAGLILAENQRDDAILALAESGDPSGVARRIRADLLRLRKAALPAGPAAAGAGDRREDPAVPGPAAGDPP